MDRRHYLRKLSTAAGLALVASAAGCGGNSNNSTTSPQGPETSSPAQSPTDGQSTATTSTPLPTAVVAKAFDIESADDGHLIVTVPVENRSNEKRTRTLVVTVEADGETYENSKAITLDSGASRTIKIDFPDVNMNEAGSLDVGVSFSE